MGPPAVLKKKLKKVQEMRTDTPGMLEALDALSTFYKPSENTLEERRNLRSDLEARGLRLVEQFIQEFEPIQERIEGLQSSIGAIQETCDDLVVKLDNSLSMTNKFAEETRALTNKREEVAERAKIMDNFLRRFKLSDKQLAALSEGPQDQDGGALFFSALEDVQRIRGECQALISSQFQSAGLELFDAMAVFQEQAYERLYGWVQNQCVGLDAEFPESSEALKRGIQTIMEAPAYYEHARDCIAETRSSAISSRFAVALTHGGPGGNPRPIEMHAHDPLRYIGDMLAWVHQNMVVEKNLVNILFTKDESQNIETLNKIFEGVMNPLMVRIRQVYNIPQPLVLGFKIVNLLQFYVGTFEAIFNSTEELPVETIRTLHKEAEQAFFDTIQSQCDKLLASPPAYPRDLSVALEVSELIRRLSEVLAVHNESLSSTPLESEAPSTREEQFAPVLDAFINPLLDMCRKSASGLDRSDTAVYIINNLVTIQSSLTRYDFTVSWVQRLTSEIGDWSDLLVKEQSDAILQRCGLGGKIELMERADPSVPISKHAGMDIESLKQVLDAFYKSMFSLVMPEFDRLTSPRLRASARNATAQTIAKAYDDFYKALFQVEKSGFDVEELKNVVLHSPDQVRQLLDA